MNKKSLLALLLAFFFILPVTTLAHSPDNCFCYYKETAGDGSEITFCVPLTAYGGETADLADDAACVQRCQDHTKEKHDSVTHLVPDGSGDINAERAECERVTEEGDQRLIELAAETEAPTPIPPIIPKLNVDLPGFTEELFNVVESGGYLEINFLGEYVVAWYRWLIGAGTIIATVMIMIGGVEYMLGKGMGQVTSAKNRIRHAVIGLVLLLGSYTILYSVNPQLTFFEPLRVDYVAFVELPLEEQADLAVDPNVEKLCDNIESCKDWCTLTSDGTDQAALEGELPSLATNGMASPDELVSISGINGLETSHSGHLILPAVLDMLKSAATAARAEGVTLYVVSSYRPLLQQLKLACDEIRAADTAGRTPKIPTAIAWPGSSAHGTGSAVDIKYKDAQDNLSWNVKYSTQSSADPDNVALLAKIMYSAGWHRYVKEIWHFQAYSGTCTSQSCTVATTSCSCN